MANKGQSNKLRAMIALFEAITTLQNGRRWRQQTIVENRTINTTG
jgi:hypothetical protein